MSDQSRLTIDDGFYILNEYMRNVRQEGQPGVGDAFLKWTLINRSNPARVMQVALTAIPWSKTAGRDPDFREFPDDPRLAAFDRSDRKFAAVALTHPDCPPVQVATDTDWWEHRKSLAEHGITIDFLCETDIRRLAAKP